MKLIVNNDNETLQDGDIAMTYGEEEIKRIIINYALQENPWLRKFNTCFPRIKENSVIITFGDYLQSSPNEKPD